MELIDDLLVYVFRLKQRRDKVMALRLDDEYKILCGIVDELEEMIDDEQELQMRNRRRGR